jgi:uncharacterized protein (TIGR03437 family)
VTDSAGVGQAAQLLFVAPGQINFLTPAALRQGPGRVTVSRLDGGSATVEASIALVSPGLFAANADGRGVAAALVSRVREGRVVSTEFVFRCDAAGRNCQPAPLDLGPEGDELVLLLFGTGIRHRADLSAVSVRIGGRQAASQYAGPQGGFEGLDQVNVALPRALSGAGVVEVALTVDGLTSNSVTIQIR